MKLEKKPASRGKNNNIHTKNRTGCMCVGAKKKATNKVNEGTNETHSDKTNQTELSCIRMVLSYSNLCNSTHPTQRQCAVCTYSYKKPVCQVHTYSVCGCGIVQTNVCSLFATSCACIWAESLVVVSGIQYGLPCSIEYEMTIEYMFNVDASNSEEQTHTQTHSSKRQILRNIAQSNWLNNFPYAYNNVENCGRSQTQL